MVAITVLLAGTLFSMVTGIIELEGWEEEDTGFPDPDQPPSFSPIYRSAGLTEEPEEVSTGEDLELSRGTVISWVKVDSSSANGGVVIKGVAQSQTEFDQSYGIRMASGDLSSGAVGSMGWCEGPNNDLSGSTGLHPVAFIAMDGSEGNIVFYGARSPVELQTGEWHMVAASFSANKIEINVYSETQHLGTASVTPAEVQESAVSGSGVQEAKDTLAAAGDSFVPRSSPGQPVMVLAQGLGQTWSNLDGSVFDWRIYGNAMSKDSADNVWLDTRNDVPS